MTDEKTYRKAYSMKEAIELLSSHPKTSKFIAGGTDMMVNKYQGNDTTQHLIDISGLDELKSIRKDDNHVYIGALVRLSDLKKNSDITNEFPVLLQAAHAVGSPLIRQTATLGGNILCENRCIYFNQSEWWREAVGYCLKCNGNVCIATGGKKACFSEFASDTAPALIALNAKVKVYDSFGERIMAIEDLYSGDGIKPKTIGNDCLIKEIMLPRGQGFKTFFKKLRLRETLEFTSLTTAVSLNNKNDLRVVLGGVDPKPVLIKAKLNDDKDELIKKAIKGGRAVENDMFSRTYRRDMIRVFLKEAFITLNL